MSRAIQNTASFDFGTDLKLAEFSVPQSVLAMKDGVVNAIMLTFGYPASAVIELNGTRDIDLVSMDEALIDKIVPGVIQMLRVFWRSRQSLLSRVPQP